MFNFSTGCTLSAFPRLTLKLGVVTALAVSSGLAIANTSQVVTVTAEHAFTPVGFDDNDEITIVLDGYLPSTCYRMIRPMVTAPKPGSESREILIEPKARKFPGPCLQTLVPYSYEIQLDSLPYGEYEVKLPESNITERLAVEEASNAGPDDYLYAPIDDAIVKSTADNQLVATISGRFTNDCLRIKDVIVTNHQKTVELRPVMDRFDDGSACENNEGKFSVDVLLPTDLEPGRHLLHVRSLNGRAKNVIFAVGE